VTKAVSVGDHVKLIERQGRMTYFRVAEVWTEESDGEEIIFAKIEVLLGENKGLDSWGPVKDLRWNGKVFVYDLRGMKYPENLLLCFDMREYAPWPIGPMLTVEEAAEYMKVDLETIQRLIREDEIPAIEFCKDTNCKGKVLHIHNEAIDEYLRYVNAGYAKLDDR
jgi:excisionase family DNA binding protein